MTGLESFIPAVLGGVGGIVSGVVKEWTDARKFKRDMEMAVFQSEREESLMKLQFAENVRDHDREMINNSWKGLEASHASDAAVKGSQWVEDFRAMMRPGITVGCLMIVFMGFMLGYEPMQLLNDITLMSVFWWFGSRPFDKTPVKIYERSDWKRTR